MPDFMQIGGATGWRRAAAIAAAAGIPISTHLYPEAAARVMRGTETAHWIEWQAWANPILRQPNEVKDGTPERRRRGRLFFTAFRYDLLRGNGSGVQRLAWHGMKGCE
jgi:L-alanine-DL-glutamate epimerase-like enolase superfamily enzyme